MRAILASFLLCVLAASGQNVSYYNQGLLKKTSQAEDLSYLGITTNGTSISALQVTQIVAFMMTQSNLVNMAQLVSATSHIAGASVDIVYSNGLTAFTNGHQVAVTSQGGSSFDPSQVANLKLRYDPNPLTSTPGVRPATLTDTSGNGYNGTTTKGGYWTNNASAVNKLGFLSFRHSEQAFYETSASSSTWSQPNTFFIVAKLYDTGGTDGYLFDSYDSPDTLAGREAVFNHSPNEVHVYAGTELNNDNIYGQWRIYEWQFSGATSFCKTNGVFRWSSSNPGANTMEGITIGNRYFTSSTSFYGSFDMAYLLMYNSAVGATDEANILIWLQNRFFPGGYP